MKTLLVFVAPVFLFCGCGVKEGAEFYSLQTQNNKLANSVSNLQVQVNALAAENNSLRSAVSTNSVAIGYLIEDERKGEVNLKKLQDQVLKIQENNKQ
jgi:hypothetical protein